MKRYLLLILPVILFVACASAQQRPDNWTKETALRGKNLAGYSQEGNVLRGYKVDSILAQGFGIYQPTVVSVTATGNPVVMRNKIVTDYLGNTYAVDFYGNARILMDTTKYATVAALNNEASQRITADNFKLNTSDTIGNYAKYRAGLLTTSNALNTFKTIDSYSNDTSIAYPEFRNSISSVSNNITNNYALKSDIGKGSQAYFYVDRRWTGSRGGASWTSQANAAIVGSTAYAFPDPWCARDSAVKYLKNGTLSSAVVYILGGNEFSYGEANSDFNTTQTGWKRYDTTNTDSTNTTTASLFYNNLHYIAEKGVKLISNAKNQYSVAFSDGNCHVNSSWKGGSFVGNFGQIDGFVTYDFMLLNTKSVIDIDVVDFDSKSGGGSNTNIKSKTFKFTADNVLIADKYFLKIQDLIGNCSYIVKIKNVLTGKFAGSSYVVNDKWATFYMQCQESSQVVFDIENAKINRGNGVFYLNWSFSNTTINIKNIVVDNDNPTGVDDGLLYMHTGYWGLKLAMNIQNGNFGKKLIDMATSSGGLQANTHIRINCAACISSDSTSTPLMTVSSVGDTTSSISISGYYQSKSKVLEVKGSSGNNMAFSTDATLKSINGSAVSIEGNTPRLFIAGNLSTSTQSSISGTGTVTIMPSATANIAAANTITQQGSTLNINAAYKK